jgi:hypothetical protein
MKALKSRLAREVLADPRAKDQLRTFLATKSSMTMNQGRDSSTGTFIEFSSEGRKVRVIPTVVRKAA